MDGGPGADDASINVMAPPDHALPLSETLQRPVLLAEGIVYRRQMPGSQVSTPSSPGYSTPASTTSRGPSDTTMSGRPFSSSIVAERCRLTSMQVRTLASHGVEPQSTCGPA